MAATLGAAPVSASCQRIKYRMHGCRAGLGGRWHTLHARAAPPPLTALPSEERLLAHQRHLETAWLKEGIEVATAGSSANPQELSFCTPAVDWSRFHLQLLFVDRTDTLRARVAAGLFDRITSWNGYGRAIYAWTAGLEAGTNDEGAEAGAEAGVVTQQDGRATRTAAVLAASAHLRLYNKDLVRPAERYERDDLDRYDLVLCLDSGIYDSIMREVEPEHLAYYKEKVCLLSGFSRYESDAVVLAGGGLALLPMQLSFLLRVACPEVAALRRGGQDIPSPSLGGENGGEEWDRMVQMLIWCTAGLAKYLMDSMPDDLSWEPLD